jgi:hypothetical protein
LLVINKALVVKCDRGIQSTFEISKIQFGQFFKAAANLL